LGRQDGRSRTSRIKGSGNEPLAPAGTSAGDLAKFTGVRGAGSKGEHAQAQAADLAPSHSGGLSASRQGSDGGGGKGTPLDTDLFAMLNMEVRCMWFVAQSYAYISGVCCCVTRCTREANAPHRNCCAPIVNLRNTGRRIRLPVWAQRGCQESIWRRDER
jgi:hypothetical protein